MSVSGFTFIIIFYSISLNSTIFLKCVDFDLLVWVWTLMERRSTLSVSQVKKKMNVSEFKLWNINLNSESDEESKSKNL